MMFENNKVSYEKIRNSFDKNKFSIGKNRNYLEKNNFLQSSQFIQATNIIQKQLLQKYTSDIDLSGAQSNNNQNNLILSSSISNQGTKNQVQSTKSSYLPPEIEQYYQLQTQQSAKQIENQNEKQIKVQPFLSNRRQQTSIGEYQQTYYIKGFNENKFMSRNKGNIFSKTLSHSLDKRIYPCMTQDSSKDIQQNNIQQKNSQKDKLQMQIIQQTEEKNFAKFNINNEIQEKQLKQLNCEIQKRNTTNNIKIPQKNYLREIAYNQLSPQQTQNQLNGLNNFISSRSYKLIQNQSILNSQLLRSSISKNTPQWQQTQQKYSRESSTYQTPLYKLNRELSLSQLNPNQEDKIKFRSLTNACNSCQGETDIQKLTQQNAGDIIDEQQQNTLKFIIENKQYLQNKYDYHEQKSTNAKQISQPTSKHQNSFNYSNYTHQIQNENIQQNIPSLNASTQQKCKNRLNDIFNNQQPGIQENHFSKDKMSLRFNQNIPIKENQQLKTELPQSKSELFIQNMNLKSQVCNKSLLTQKQNLLQVQQANSPTQFLKRKYSIKQQNNEDDELQPWQSNDNQDIFESPYAEKIPNKVNKQAMKNKMQI